MIWRQNTCVNWCPFESHPENSGHPVRYYCRCQCLGSGHIVIVRLVLQAPILWNKLPANIRNASSLGNFKSLLKTHLFKVAFTDK